MIDDEMVARLAQFYGCTQKEIWNAPLYVYALMVMLAPGLQE